MKRVFFGIFLILLIWTRFYNLERTARFIWDESSDLVKIHQYYVNKTVTLVGPISEDGSKVFGSLTYYMLMPFAVIGDFKAISTAYGAAFWGSLTVVLLLWLVYRLNHKWLVWVAILGLFWFPLVQTGRWAWNPNLIPFWATLGLLLYIQKKPWSYLLSGICLGMMIHLHYLAIFAVGGFLLVNLWLALNKEISPRQLTELFGGVGLTILPFVIFDLRHPPGLFLSRVLYFNHLETIYTIKVLVEKFARVIGVVLNYYFQFKLSIWIGGLVFIGLLVSDIQNKSRSLKYLIPWLTQLGGLLLIEVAYDYYTLPGIIFFLAWVLYPRKNIAGAKLAAALVATMIIASLFSFWPQMTTSNWESNLKATQEISDILAQEIRTADLKNVEVAVLQSPDPNSYGRRYRDLLLIEGISIMDKAAYPLADHLFVITSGTKDEVIADRADVMNYFREGPMKKEWKIDDSIWRMYLFDRK